MTARALTAEFLGTALLLLAIVGSGITAAGGGSPSAQLFHHAATVGAALFALILTFGAVSGAHFNPAVTVVDAWFNGLRPRTAAGYVAAQLAGAALGTVIANMLFGLPAVAASSTPRAGIGLAASEATATFGLLLVIFGVVRSGRSHAVPAAVGAWVAAAIYCTSSASFANPAVTVARSMTDTYTGISPGDVPAFLLAQVVGGLAVIGLIAWLFAPSDRTADQVVLPHEPSDFAADPTPQEPT